MSVERHERTTARRGPGVEEAIAQLGAGQLLEAWVRAQPLELGVPVLEVDTTDGYMPNLDAIVPPVRSAAAHDHEQQDGGPMRTRQ
ncbi:MAG: hypothetical protein HY332_05385 [Chloroflexi bacterium]|nr:hypothetical protein [Chloroflexota bacterium]